LIDNSVFHDEVFDPKVMDCLPKVSSENPWKIPQKERERRLDLTGLSIFTIDPLTAKDLDDAVHIRELDGGFFEVGFVLEHSLIRLECILLMLRTLYRPETLSIWKLRLERLLST
jgi:hypothetical protein